MSNTKYDEKLKKLDLLAKMVADKNPALVEKGRKALEEKGLSDSNSIYSFIRSMICVLGTSGFRPATRIPRVAYWYVGEQLKNNEDFRYKFNKTTVNHDQTMFNIDGELFETNTKSNSRSKKSNVDELTEELEKLIESATTIESHDSIEKNESDFKFDKSSIFNEFVEPTGTPDNSSCPMNSHTTNEIESDTRPVEIGSCVEDAFWNSVSSDFNFSDEYDEFDGFYTY
jgi:hypothetical protein